MTLELIEQRESKLQKIGGSNAIIIPMSWLEKLEFKEEDIIVFRLCKGKHGLFLDGFKKKVE